MKTNCPFCEGNVDGCCFCDHTGKIDIGDGYRFSNETEIQQSKGVAFLKAQDKASNGDIEMWPEMIDHFLDEKNIPKWYNTNNNLNQ